MSLVYEVVWARLLAIHLGSTTEGHTLVIATFMGGLGLGYAWLGRHADRVENPLRLYAGLELGITLWALCVPSLIDAGSQLLGGTWLLAVVAVAVPTTLMGGTLPALTAALARKDAPGKTIAGLYGINALGAAIGVFVAGFWLIESLGVRGAGWAAAGVNGTLALAAWALSRGAAQPSEGATRPVAAGPLVRWACVSACVVGLASMALQGAWIRLFAVVLGSSSYSFTLVIGVYILGMALGSLMVRFSMARMSPLLALSSLSVGAALVLWLTAPWFSALPFELAGLREALYDQGASFGRYTATRLGLVAGLIALPTLAFGAALPLAAKVAAVGRPGAGTGVVFAWNTVGAVIGAATSVPLLVGWWGLDGVHQAGALTLAGLGVILALAASGRRARPVLIALGLVALFVPLVSPVSWDPREVSAGAFRMRERKADTRGAFRDRLHKSDLIFHADGPDATVAVLERKGDRVMMVNGKPDASTRGDMVTQVMSAHVPLVLHPAPKTALVVGLGSGVTVGSALTHSELAVDVVEVSQAVVDASRYFDGASGAPLDDPRVTLITDDVRSALRRRPEVHWDVIISEPSNPWVAGNAGLFSVDYFKLLASHLAPDGVAAQWVQRYETDDATLTMVIRSFAEAFAHVEIWQLYPTDLLLVGHGAPPRPDLAGMAERLARPAIAQDLARVKVPGLDGLLSLQAMTHGGVATLLEVPGPVNTDDHPILEFEGPRRLYAGAKASLIAAHDVRVGLSSSDGHHRAGLPASSLATLQALFAFHTTYPGAPEGFRASWLERLVDESDVAFLIQLLFTIEAEARWPWVTPTSDRLLSLAPEHPKALYVVARARRAWDNAIGSRTQQSRVHELFTRCVALGDEPRGRCAKGLSE
ncbi:MAG: fused MFS/spermidine synthase [Myxococcota bacterium]